MMTLHDSKRGTQTGIVLMTGKGGRQSRNRRGRDSNHRVSAMDAPFTSGTAANRTQGSVLLFSNGNKSNSSNSNSNNNSSSSSNSKISRGINNKRRVCPQEKQHQNSADSVMTTKETAIGTNNSNDELTNDPTELKRQIATLKHNEDRLMKELTKTRDKNASLKAHLASSKEEVIELLVSSSQTIKELVRTEREHEAAKNDLARLQQEFSQLVAATTTTTSSSSSSSSSSSTTTTATNTSSSSAEEQRDNSKLCETPSGLSDFTSSAEEQVVVATKKDSSTQTIETNAQQEQFRVEKEQLREQLRSLTGANMDLLEKLEESKAALNQANEENKILKTDLESSRAKLEKVARIAKEELQKNNLQIAALKKDLLDAENRAKRFQQHANSLQKLNQSPTQKAVRGGGKNRQNLSSGKGASKNNGSKSDSRQTLTRTPPPPPLLLPEWRLDTTLQTNTPHNLSSSCHSQVKSFDNNSNTSPILPPFHMGNLSTLTPKRMTPISPCYSINSPILEMNNDDNDNKGARSKRSSSSPHVVFDDDVRDIVETEFKVLKAAFSEDEIKIKGNVVTRQLVLTAGGHDQLAVVNLVAEIARDYPLRGGVSVSALISEESTCNDVMSKCVLQSLPSLLETCRREADAYAGSEALFAILTSADRWASTKWWNTQKELAAAKKQQERQQAPDDNSSSSSSSFSTSS